MRTLPNENSDCLKLPGRSKDLTSHWILLLLPILIISAFCWNGGKTSHQDSGEPYLVFTLTHFIPSNHHLTEFSHTST